MRLVAIEAENWLSYPDLSLDFSDVQQVVVTGPNGHGKSALLDAIRYSLFGEGRGSADDMISHGALQTVVTTTWNVDGHDLEVTRSRSKASKAGSTDLRVTVDGVSKTQHTIGDTQAVINRLIKLEPSALMATAFMVQGEADSIMRATPASRKELLVELLGLEQYEAWHAEAKKRALAAANEVEVHHRLILEHRPIAERIAPSAEAMERHGRHLGVFEKEVDLLASRAEELKTKVALLKERQERLASLNAQHAAIADQHDRNHKALKRAQGAYASTEEQSLQPAPEFEATPPEQTVTEEDMQKWKESRVYLGELRYTVERKTEQLQESARWRELATTVPCGGRGKYATCQFLHLDDVDEDHLNDDIGTANAVIATLESMKDPEPAWVAWQTAYNGWLQKKSAHESSLAHWNNDQARIALELPRLKQQLEDAAEAVEASDRSLATIQRERLKLSQDELDYDELEKDITTIVGKLDAAKDKRNNEKMLLDQARLDHKQALLADQRLAEETVKRADALAEQDKYKVLADAFHRDGIPTMILENTLPAIEAKANAILGEMPGGFSIEILTQKQTKTSGMRDTLDISVLVDGLPRTYGLLSGGERFRVDFALRVALSAVIATRSGTSVRTLWLDEPLAHLDRTGRESVLDTLNAVGDAFDLVVVVSHHDEFNDRFPSKVEVSKNGHSVAVLT